MSHLDLDQGHRQSHLFSVFTFSTAIYIKPLTLLHSEWPDLQRVAVSQFSVTILAAIHPDCNSHGESV